MLSLTIGGTLGRDPETRDVGQTTVTDFSVAVNGYDRRAKEKTTTWVKVTVWGTRGEQLAGFLGKGDKVMATGVASLVTYTPRDGGEKRVTLELNASDVAPMGKGKSHDDEESPPARRKTFTPAPAAKDQDFPDDDDIPF